MSYVSILGAARSIQPKSQTKTIKNQGPDYDMCQG